MGCHNNLSEDPNTRIRRAIKEMDYAAIHVGIASSNFNSLDPTLIHDAVKSGHIEIIGMMLDNS